jgi:hypothetical protein
VSGRVRELAEELVEVIEVRTTLGRFSASILFPWWDRTTYERVLDLDEKLTEALA